MPATDLQSSTRHWTAAELRRLPTSDRDVILAAAAALAEDDYVHDAKLTDFEAFGKEDLCGESSNTAADPG